MLEIITTIIQWMLIICLIIRIRIVEKEVENIKSWEPFVTILNSKIGEKK